MQEKLRRSYQVQKEVPQRGYFEGDIALSELKRLIELQCLDASDPGRENITLRFEFVSSEYGCAALKGHLDACIKIECKRCLGPMTVPMNFEFNLLIDASEALVAESSMDTIYSNGGYVDLFEVIEDEIMLACPLVASHEDDSCNEYWPAPEKDSAPAAKENPFSVLKVLKA